MKRPFVIKAGGELLLPGPVRKKILSGLKQAAKRHPLVFVHGGGPQIEQELKRNNVPTQFVKGRRLTSPEAMVYVERVLSGQINKGIAAELSAANTPSVGLSCRDALSMTGRPIAGLGRAASVVKVKTDLLMALLSNRFVPILSSVAADSKGHAVNVNADDAASALAIALKAERLIFLTNTSGVLDAAKKRIPLLRSGAVADLIETGVISGGMIPKIQSACNAIDKGVGEVDILNGGKGIDFSSGTRIQS
jgi:acetylglutamate kinase